MLFDRRVGDDTRAVRSGETRYDGRWARPCVVAGLIVAVLAACLPVRAHAGWRDDLRVFRIGFVEESAYRRSAGQIAEIEKAYTQALGVPAKVVMLRNYAALIDAQAGSRVDYAVYSAAAYATAWLSCRCVAPVAAPTSTDGATGIRAALITRDGRVGALDALAGHKIALVSSASAAGYFFPMNELAARGVKLTPGTGTVVDAASASQAERMLVDGKVDAMFGWVPASDVGDENLAGRTLERLRRDGLDPATLSIVWKSSLLRYGPHAVRSDIAPELKTILSSFLANMKEGWPEIYDLVEARHGGGFVAVSQSDYDGAIAMVAAIAGTGLQ